MNQQQEHQHLLRVYLVHQRVFLAQVRQYQSSQPHNLPIHQQYLAHQLNLQLRHHHHHRHTPLRKVFNLPYQVTLQL